MEHVINEIVEKYKQANALREQVKKEYGVLGVRVDHDGILGATYSVLVQHKTKRFFQKFSSFELMKRDDDVFPYEAVATENGIKHITLLDNEEHAEYVLKEAK